MMIDGELHGRVTPESFDALIAAHLSMNIKVYVPRDATALSLGAGAGCARHRSAKRSIAACRFS